MSERELSDAEIDAALMAMPAIVHASPMHMRRAVYRAGWQARAGYAAPPASTPAKLTSGPSQEGAAGSDATPTPNDWPQCWEFASLMRTYGGAVDPREAVLAYCEVVRFIQAGFTLTWDGWIPLYESPLTRGLVGDPSPMPPGSAGSHTPTDNSAPVAPDSLVARLREMSVVSSNRVVATLARQAADELERLMGPCLSDHPGCVFCMEKGTPVEPGCVCPKCGDRKPTQGYYDMWTRAQAAESRLERVTQAARRYEWLRDHELSPWAAIRANGAKAAADIDAAFDDAIRAEKDS